MNFIVINERGLWSSSEHPSSGYYLFLFLVRLLVGAPGFFSEYACVIYWLNTSISSVFLVLKKKKKKNPEYDIT